MRMRITVLAMLVVGAALIGSGVALVILQKDAMAANVDDMTRLRAADIAGLIESGTPPASLVANNGDDAAAIQVVDATGVVVAASPNLAGGPRISILQPPAGDTATEDLDALPFEGEPFHLLARTVASPTGPLTIYVAGSLDEVEEGAGTLTRLLMIGIPLMLAVVAAATWWLVGRALAPVEAIRAEVASISSHDLEHRVPQPRAEDEVGRLARTMNEMLARLEASRDRQQRFVADAAHELRNPIASMRALLEATGQQDGGHDSQQAVLEELVRMQRLANDLLVLARYDAGDRHAATSLVDLDDIVLREARRARVTAPSLAINTSHVSAAAVRGDPEALSRCVRNLIDNAVGHARKSVTVHLSESSGVVVLRVSDDGPGIRNDDRDRIFERFVRGDPSRASHGPGAGLGLSIVRSTTEAHGGRVIVDPAFTGGASFVITLPSAVS